MKLIEKLDARDITPITFVERYLSTNTPVIIKGALDHCAATRRWRLREIVSRYGHLTLSVSKDEHVDRADGHMTMDEFLKQLERKTAKPDWLYAFQDVSNDPVRYKALWDDFEVPGFINLPKDACVVSRFYIGSCDSGAYPHAHTETINVLVEGRKEWILYPMSDSALALAPAYREETHQHWFRNVVANCPLPTACSAVQETGEILFVPRYIVHATLNHTATVGITWRWNGSEHHKEPPIREVLPESMEMGGSTVVLVSHSRLHGLTVGLYVPEDANAQNAFDSVVPFSLKLVITDRQRARTLLNQLFCSLASVANRLIRRQDFEDHSGFSTIVIGFLKDETLLLNGNPVQGDGLRQMLIDVFFGDKCFNETIRDDLKRSTRLHYHNRLESSDSHQATTDGGIDTKTFVE